MGVIFTRLLYARVDNKKTQSVNKEYFKGLNFLLNEETDKAIEVFIKALEVDSETVELHLALGGLFRRKGQVDRATRIHQNLIARPTLTDDQRMQAVHELACDYHKAGWLDRAENLFLELQESEIYRALAITGLCRIYEQEKEWQKAIDVLQLHKRELRVQVSKEVAHYQCELAEDAINSYEFLEAKKYLKQAKAVNPSVGRTLLLVGDLEFAEGKYSESRVTWAKLAKTHPKMAELIVDRTINSYLQSKSEQGLGEYLLGVSAIPRDQSAFLLWQESLVRLFGLEQAATIIFEKSLAEGLSAPLAEFLTQTVEQELFSNSQKQVLLKKMLDRAKTRKIEYTCRGCGFDTKSMYWFCPNCGRWESFE